MQRGGRIWASATIYLSCNALECNYCGPTRKLRVGPPHVQSVSDRRRRLTRQRVQRRRGRTDEARRETVRAADCKRKRLGRQNEVGVRRSQTRHCS